MMFEGAIAEPKIVDADLRQAVEELSASILVGGEGFSGYVSNVWIMEDGDWLLVSAEISSTARTD